MVQVAKLGTVNLKDIPELHYPIVIRVMWRKENESLPFEQFVSPPGNHGESDGAWVGGRFDTRRFRAACESAPHGCVLVAGQNRLPVTLILSGMHRSI